MTQAESTQTSAPEAVLRYVLTASAVRLRARVVAATGMAAAMGPAWLVIVLAAQLGLVSHLVTTAFALVVGALGVARGVLVHRRARRRLAAFAVTVQGESLAIATIDGETRVPPSAITGVSEIDGAYGGLRVTLAGPGLPPRFDVPRGGEAFADLRAWLTGRAPVVRTPRRGRLSRVAISAAVVLALFFVPFVVADARGSRLAIALVLLVAWGAMRAIAMRA